MDKKNAGRTCYRNISRIVGLVAALVFVLTPNIAAGVILERIVANVNGEIILLSELRRQVAIFRAMKQRGTLPDTGKQLNEKEILQNLVDEKIITRHATENNMTVKESEVDKRIEDVKQNNGFDDKALAKALKADGLEIEEYRTRLKNQILIGKITGFELPPVAISDTEVKSYYRRHKDKFFNPGKVRASHIVLLAKLDSDKEYVKQTEAKIKSIFEEIKNGADFAEMAKKYSQDGAAPVGGDLGWFEKGEMAPDFENAAFALHKGDVCDPVRTAFGFHLIKCTGREEEGYEPLEIVMERIRAKLNRDVFVKRRAEWIKRLRSEAYVEVLY